MERNTRKPTRHGRRSIAFIDHLLALVIAIALPLAAVVSLLQAVTPADIDGTEPDEPSALSVQWVTVVRAPGRAPSPRRPPIDDSATSDSPVLAPTPVRPDESDAKNTPSESTDSPVGLPIESGGSVYDPSRMAATAVSASTFLRTPTATSDDSPANAMPLVLADRAPEVPSQLHGLKKVEVKVALEIDTSGRVTDANLIAGSGDAEIDSAILDAARTWLFEPARIAGEAVASRLELDVAMEQFTNDATPP